jgi:hypothetical protein
MSRPRPAKVAAPVLPFQKALALLRRPGSRLAKLHKANGGTEFYIWPDGGPVSHATASALLERNDVQPYDSGLLPDYPQSWRLGDWRAPKREEG